MKSKEAPTAFGTMSFGAVGSGCRVCTRGEEHMRLAGKVAVITGAASGIGRATAQLFAREGARLMLGGVDESGVRQVAERVVRVEHQVEGSQHCD